MRLVFAIACLTACDRRPAITACTDDLTGEYASGDRRWMILDHGATLEAYPLFPDVPGAGSLEVAPRHVNLARKGSVIAGEVRRRYTSGAAMCVARMPARVTACTNNELDLVFAETSPPVSFVPCRWPSPQPNRRERWIRR